MEFARLIEQLSDPRVYPDATAKVAVHQTHISVVFVTDAFAYKVKKPVALEFLDYSTLEKRAHWCDEEIRLNRRLAPPIYLGVVPIASQGSGVCVEGPRPVVECAVKMHRLPTEASLARVVEHGDLGTATITSLARRIADFHRHADHSPEIARFGRFDVVARNARENFEQSKSQVGNIVSERVFDRLQTLTEEWLAQHRALIEDRADHGIPCDGHGDVRLDHIYLFPENTSPDDLAIVDCIEFNLRFRAADPIADMAFLVMDLIRHGYRELAHSFRSAYLACAGDDEGARLVPFYVAYRAAVRAKVNGIKAGAAELSSSARAKAERDARAQWMRSHSSLEEPARRPCLVLIGRLPGTGKSTLAREVARHANFEVIRSDEIRKQLARGAATMSPTPIGPSISKQPSAGRRWERRRSIIRNSLKPVTARRIR
jgi:aminoglycoside phosphotransferase family enzyme